jgi:lycopene beta-cyclase
MDAATPQHDGYRFIYILPYSDHSALVEDTRYADGAQLNRRAIRADIVDYCRSREWKIARIIREEKGVLPIALAGDIDAYLSEVPSGIALAGMRAALFHPLTGYSLPDAAALADLIAAQRDLSGPALARLTRIRSAQVWRQRGYYRLLCRMLFSAADPSDRYKVLQRFYRLPKPLIERFYAGKLQARDKARILVGKPPVPIRRAMNCVNEHNYLRRMQ